MVQEIMVIEHTRSPLAAEENVSKTKKKGNNNNHINTRQLTYIAICCFNKESARLNMIYLSQSVLAGQLSSVSSNHRQPLMIVR